MSQFDAQKMMKLTTEQFGPSMSLKEAHKMLILLEQSIYLLSNKYVHIDFQIGYNF
jgi:hypothetical protein